MQSKTHVLPHTPQRINTVERNMALKTRNHPNGGKDKDRSRLPARPGTACSGLRNYDKSHAGLPSSDVGAVV